jgi:phosphomannomutase
MTIYNEESQPKRNFSSKGDGKHVSLNKSYYTNDKKTQSEGMNYNDAGSPVVLMKDFVALEAIDFIHNEHIALEMPTTSNVLQFFTEDDTKLSIRPSGTEPKIKYYIEVHDKVNSRNEIAEAEKKALEKINTIRNELNI